MSGKGGKDLGVRQWVINWLEAGRTKNEPDRQTESYPLPFGYMMSIGNNQPVPKRTPTNLRSLSESPIPRRAINVIKNGITKLNWSVAAIDDNDSEKYAEVCKIIERSLLKPNPGDSFRSWIEQVIEDMLVCSAGSTEILKAGDPQRPFRMYPTDSFSIDLYPDWDGKLESYRYAQRVNGQYVHLKASEMMYIRMNPRTNTPFGLSPLELVWESVNYFIAAHRSAGKQTGNPFIRQILNLGKSADKNAVAAYRTYWEMEVQGRGSTPIIGGTENPSVLNLGAVDDKALFIEWQRFLIEVVAIAFDISPKKLGQTKDVNRSTADSEDDDTEETIQSIAENIVEHINNHIIDGIFHLGGAIEFKFHYETSLKQQKLKADIDAIYLDRRVKTPDEVRDEMAKKALPNRHGEVLLMPGKTTVVDINKAAAGTEEDDKKNDPPIDAPEQNIDEPDTDT
ncbi:Phage portal protein [compost metagenome]